MNMVQIASEESELKKIAKQEGIIKEEDPDKRIKDELKQFDPKQKEKLKKQKRKAPKVPFHPGYEKELTKPELTVKEKRRLEKKKKNNVKKEKAAEEKSKQNNDQEIL